MTNRGLKCFIGVTLAAVSPLGALAYMEYPPTTLAKLCTSPRIRLLKVTKFDKEKGVVIFELVGNLNTPNDKVKSTLADKIPGADDKVRQFRHAIPTDRADAKPVLEWAAKDQAAVLFTIEQGGQIVSERACGYMFIDKNCYSVVYHKAGDYWSFIRAEPQMSACYFGKADDLSRIVKDLLAGKEVKVPTKEPDTKTDFGQRAKEVFEALNASRVPPKK